jgi:hypothetical protein
MKKYQFLYSATLNMRINSLKCKTISLMNGSGAGHSKKNMLLVDLYMFDKFQKKTKF